MQVQQLEIPGVWKFTPKVFVDERGRFLETHRTSDIHDLAGARGEFVQSNVSYSVAYVLRGLHYQIQEPQGKLVRCLQGQIYDVAVDIRNGSATFGKWCGSLLDDHDCAALWVPPGFAHGFLAMGGPVIVQYECTSYYRDEWARSIRWDDPTIGVRWPIPQGRSPILSQKDRAAGLLSTTDRL